MALDLSSLTSSIGALERALHVTADGVQWAGLSPETQEAVRAGVVQNFEVAYEQSWKMMRRWLEANPLAGDVSGATMRQVYRLAAKAGLIDDVDLWMDFHQARNQTAHTYNSKTAEMVFALSARFLPEAKRTLGVLEARND
ncbi:MAG: nucleotidyltransferase substrate binding protein [Burkholderiaceae bacterium]